MLAVAKGELASQPAPVFADQTALTVVMAANGYPGTPETGGAIGGIDKAEATGAKVFHAGTRMEGDTLVSSGGRVLNVTALGDTVASPDRSLSRPSMRSISRPASAAATSAGARSRGKARS
jgi:phosphoribosylamine--glycine ligase